jgi:hypothetical protein
LFSQLLYSSLDAGGTCPSVLVDLIGPEAKWLPTEQSHAAVAVDILWAEASVGSLMVEAAVDLNVEPDDWGAGLLISEVEPASAHRPLALDLDVGAGERGFEVPFTVRGGRTTAAFGLAGDRTLCPTGEPRQPFRGGAWTNEVDERSCMAEGGEEFVLRCVEEYRGRVPVDQIAVHAAQLGAL